MDTRLKIQWNTLRNEVHSQTHYWQQGDPPFNRWIQTKLVTPVTSQVYFQYQKKLGLNHNESIRLKQAKSNERLIFMVRLLRGFGSTVLSSPVSFFHIMLDISSLFLIISVVEQGRRRVSIFFLNHASSGVA